MLPLRGETVDESGSDLSFGGLVTRFSYKSHPPFQWVVITIVPAQGLDKCWQLVTVFLK